MGKRGLLVVALVSVGALVGACGHRVQVQTAPSGPTRWIMDPEADDDDQFCVPSPHNVGTKNDEVFPLRCTSVGDIRRHVRALRAAP